MQPGFQHTHHYIRNTLLQVGPFPGLNQGIVPKGIPTDLFCPWHLMNQTTFPQLRASYDTTCYFTYHTSNWEELSKEIREQTHFTYLLHRYGPEEGGYLN